MLTLPSRLRKPSPNTPQTLATLPTLISEQLASGVALVDGCALLAIKGAPEAVLERTVSWRGKGGVQPMHAVTRAQVLEVAARQAIDGGRVLAVASRTLAVLPTSGRDD